MSRRGLAGLGAAALALIIGFGAWEAVEQAAALTAGTKPSLALTAPSPQGVSAATVGPAVAAAPNARALVVARASFDPTAIWAVDSPPLRPGEVEVCGFGRAGADSPEAKALQRQASDQMNQAAERLFAIMDRSPDPHTRAAALLARDERDALADAAQRTSDPTIYALAMQACSRGGPNPRSATCAALNAGQMARLDTDNVVPWLYVAAEASQRSDTAGVAEAVYRASLAKRSRLREFQFTELALSALPADWPPPEAMLASAKVLEIHAGLSLPSYLAPVQYCAKERMHDANRQQTCERLARVLMNGGDTLVDYGIGRRLGERSGWPAEVVEMHNARFEAYKQTLADGDGLGSSTACHALRRDVRLAFEHARRGELAHAQAEVERSGASDAALVERFRVDPRPNTPALTASAPR